MIGLKSTSENEIDLSYDINLLPTLTLMPEAGLHSSFCHGTFCLPRVTACLSDAHRYWCVHMALQSWMNDLFLTSLT